MEQVWGEEGGPRLSRGMEVETLEYLWNEVTRRWGGWCGAGWSPEAFEAC